VLAASTVLSESGGVGSTGRMSAELFQMMARIKFTHVPYRGEALALADLMLHRPGEQHRAAQPAARRRPDPAKPTLVTLTVMIPLQVETTRGR
jgi:hypothetical protein